MNEVVSLAIKDVQKNFGAVTALDGVSMKFTEGEMHGIIGPEGAGKTTLMRIILGLLKANQGAVSFHAGGKEISFESIRPAIAYMPQSQSLYPDLSIEEHLDFFKEMYGIPQKDYASRRAELLEITRLAPFADRPAGKLSGGMYKKLGLMCALLRAPRVMLLDEPTNGVDPISRREFWELLYRLSDQNILILVTTAYMDEAERCDQVHLLSSGKVVAEGNPRDILQKENVRTFDDLFLKRASSV